MSDTNEVWITGRLDEDPRVSENSEVGAATIKVEVRRSFKTKEGKSVEIKDWFRVKLFGRQAAYTVTHLSAGSHVVVKGRMQTDRWKDKTTGEQRHQVVIVADMVRELIDEVEGAEAEARGADGQEVQPPTREEAAAPTQPAVDVGSRAYEELAGIQPVPFD